MGQTERWYWVDKGCRLMQHMEFDGCACLWHGPCATDVPVDVDSLTVHEARAALRCALL